MRYKTFVMRCMLPVVISTSSFANTGENSTVFNMLQSDMEKYSNIAIETKQNVDYMPYIISVLNSNELKKLGVLTLKEALYLVPGVDISIGMLGVNTPIFRGSNPFAVGQSKLVIDGVIVNDQMFGAYNQYLDMPVSIIERIEVVRGPGSLIDGLNAYSGSIHVVTKASAKNLLHQKNHIFGAFGSNDYAMGGYVASFEHDDLKISSDLFYQRHNLDLLSGPDRFNNTLEAPLWIRNYALSLNVEYKNFYLKGRYASNKDGVSYGQSFSLSEDESDFLKVANTFLESGVKFGVTDDIEGKFFVGYFDEHRDLQNKVMPDNSTMLMKNANGMIMKMSFPKGYYFLVDYTEQTFYEALEFDINSFEGHEIVAGVKLTQSEIKDKTARHSRDSMKSFTVEPLLSNEERKLNSFYLSDLINIDEKNSFKLDIKYDHFSDVAEELSGRLAYVHRYSDEHIYKFMYTHSYKEPAWREQYLIGSHYFASDEDVTSETVEAFELSYIYRPSMKTSLKINTFLLQNQDQIFAHLHEKTKTFILHNHDAENRLYGLEIEYRRKINSKSSLYFNYSYVNGENVLDTLADSANNLAKAYYMYDVSDNLTLSAIGRYVGSKDRIIGDTRENVKSYALLDVTAAYNYQPYDLSLTFSVKNLFDKKYRLPSPIITYPNDFEQEGTSVLVQFEKRF